MPDFILLEGDKANFLPNFGAAVVVVRPGDLKGSGPATLTGKKICVDGDEKKVVSTRLHLHNPPVLDSGYRDAQNCRTGRQPESNENENGRQGGAAQRR